MNLSIQRAAALSGLDLVGFWVVGGFVPPPTPERTALETPAWCEHSPLRMLSHAVMTHWRAGRT
jgi:hypothetical protein